METLSRGVREDDRPRPVNVACPIRDCEGVLYTLQPGEHLSRLTRPGWDKQRRQCMCPQCGREQGITVLVRAAK